MKARFFTALVRMYWWKFKGNRFFLAAAARKARRLHKKTGRHYSVYFLNGKYRPLTRADLQRRKHNGVFGWHVNATSMAPFAFYSTLNSTIAPCISTSTK